MAIDFRQNLKAYLKKLKLQKMSGHQKFLAVAAHLSGGATGTVLRTSDIRDQWKKSVLGGRYNSSYYDRAQREGWVNPSGKAVFVITDSGVDQLSALFEQEGVISKGELKKSGSLVLVNRTGTHTFDKWLRGILAGAKRQVLIADSYVDHSIFDNLLDLVSKSAIIKLLYGKSSGSFDARSRRFQREYPKYEVRKYKKFHDRFMICDGVGYFLGPSLKDAASNFPATIVLLKSSETQMLEAFFRELWKKA